MLASSSNVARLVLALDGKNRHRRRRRVAVRQRQRQRRWIANDADERRRCNVATTAIDDDRRRVAESLLIMRRKIARRRCRRSLLQRVLRQSFETSSQIIDSVVAAAMAGDVAEIDGGVEKRKDVIVRCERRGVCASERRNLRADCKLVLLLVLQLAVFDESRQRCRE